MDRIIRCITSDGAIMAAAIDSTDIVYTAQQLHKLSAVSSAALGRLLTASSLMGVMLKQENASITLKINGGGPIGNVVAVSDSHGICRGYVDHPQVELPLRADGKLDVGGAVGNTGRLGVIRDLGQGEPYAGQVELVSGEIAEDISSYYAVSEQVPTVCALGVLVDRESRQVLLAGGLLIQLLPGADEQAIERLEKNVAVLEPVTTMLAKGMTVEEICASALDGFTTETLVVMPVHYGCTCSRERVLRALSTLAPDEILSLADEKGYAEANCHYCGKKYQISLDELKVLAKNAAGKNQGAARKI